MAKGMGNGFPVAGILISDKFEAKYGMLGTTFGGNYLACAASLAVLEIIETENLLENAKIKGERLKKELSILKGLKEYRGEALMIGLEMEYPINDMRNKLLSEYKIFTGSASCKNTIRLLPALNISDNEIDFLLDAFFKIVK
jgi:acetylornithine/N-succinyldiaminopimelate aminotransferase